MRNVERQTSMRYATGTGGSWRWFRDALSVLFQKFIRGVVQQHSRTNKLKGVGISLGPPDLQLIGKMEVYFFPAKASGWGRDLLPPTFLSQGILPQFSLSWDKLHSWGLDCQLAFSFHQSSWKKTKNCICLHIQHTSKELQKLGEL